MDPVLKTIKETLNIAPKISATMQSTPAIAIVVKRVSLRNRMTFMHRRASFRRPPVEPGGNGSLT